MADTSTAKSPWRTAENRAEEREEKRKAVLHAAAAAFAERGYHGTSLDVIAARLGVTKPTIYYYARNKDDLVTAVGERALAAILAAAQGDEQASALTQLQHLLTRYAEVMTTDEGRCVPVLRDARIASPANENIRMAMSRIDRRIRELLDLGGQDGSIGRCDVKLTAFMLAGAINEIGRWYDPEGSLSAALIAEKIVNQLTTGLAPR